MVVQEVLQRRLEPWRWGVQWLAIGSWQRPTKRIIKVDSLTTTGEVAQEFSIDLSMMVWYLKQIAKVKKLSKWVYCEQTANQKSHPFGESSSLILHNNNKPFLNWIVMCNEKWILYDNQLSGWTEKKLSKHFPKPNLHWKKGHTHCLVVCCLSDQLQLSESQQSHYIWEVCSANRWDALKTATPAAGIGQQKGPNSFPRQCPTTSHTTKASKVEQIGLWSFASSAVFTWPLANWLLLL